MDRVAGSIAKANRAKEHIDDLQRSWFEWGARCYALVPQQDGDRWQGVVRILEPIPDRLSTVIGDVLSNLRAALDYLVVQGLDKEGKPVQSFHYFPIAKDAASYPSQRDGRVKGVGQDFVDVLDALKPYNGGTDGFFHLNELARRDKHHLLLTTVVREESVGFRYKEMFPGMPDEFRELLGDRALWLKPANPRVMKDGDVVVGGPGPVPSHPGQQFAVQIAFGESEVLACQPVIPTLRDLAGLVESTLEAFRPVLI